MVRHLVVDAVRRKWRVSAFAMFQIYLLVKLLGDVRPSMAGMASTLAAASFLAIGAGSVFQSREFYQFPVPRRTWWLARWWLSVTAPVAIAQAAFTLAHRFSQSQWPSGEQTVLFVIFGFLYCGTGMAMQTTAIGKAGEEPYTMKSTGWIFLIILALVAAPFVFARYLPHSFGEIGAAWMVVMLVMAALTVVGYRHTPEILPRPDMRMARRFVPSVPSAVAGTPPTMAPPTGYFARLTGARMVVWEECRKQFFLHIFVLVAGVVAWAITSRFRAVPPLTEVLRLAAAFPFSSPRATVAEPLVFTCVLLIAGMAEGWMAAKIRLLRTLPLSSTQLGAVPAGLGLIAACMLWIVLLALHGLVVRALPLSLRPDLFIAFAALSATMHTIRFIVGGQSGGRAVLSFTPVAAVWLGLGFMNSWQADTAQTGMLVGGVLMLAASWGVMRNALVFNSGMYRPRTVGVPTP